MKLQLALRLGAAAELVLDKLVEGEIEIASLWDCTLVTGQSRIPLGAVSIDRLRRGLMELADADRLEFFPAAETCPRHAYVVGFSDENGPNGVLYVVEVPEGLELAWELKRHDRLTFHRTGAIVDVASVDQWMATLDSIAEQENWPPSKLYRLYRDPEFLRKKIIGDESSEQGSETDRVASAVALYGRMTPSERDAFARAVERMLSDDSESVRALAIHVRAATRYE